MKFANEHSLIDKVKVFEQTIVVTRPSLPSREISILLG